MTPKQQAAAAIMRTALQAAESALHDAGERGASVQRATAETVAAFLKSYKFHWERGMPAYLLPDDGADLAAAVEEAARDG